MTPGERMAAFTVERGGALRRGVPVTAAGRVRFGNEGEAPEGPPTDPRADVQGGELVSAPGRGALLLFRDQAGEHGSWHLRDAQPEARWDAMVAAEAIPDALDRIFACERVRARYPHRAPVGWYEFARWTRGGGEGGRPLADVYGYLSDGDAVELRRRGRLEGGPSVLRVACVGGEVVVSDPRAMAVERRRAGVR